MEMQYGPGKEVLPVLDLAEKNLRSSTKDFEGAMIERKKYAIAVHYRNLAEDKVDQLKEVVYAEKEKHKELRIGSGKKILELRPDIDWHKGHALNWIMDALNIGENHVPIFIGDDTTDEDAFKSIRNKGIGVIVGTHEENRTSATYRLENTDEVSSFLELLKDYVEKT
jgi:trehalose 6-phosphate phosphatase